MTHQKDVWVDATRYTQSKPRGSRKPTAFKIHGDEIGIWVGRHIHAPDSWTMHCDEVGISSRQLESVDIEDAKIEAVELVARRLQQLSRTVQRWL